MLASEELVSLLERRQASLSASHPELAGALDLQAELIRASLGSARSAQAQPFPLPREQVATRLEHGVPLLHDQPAQVDVHYAADLFSRLVNVLQQRDEPAMQARLAALVAAATGGLLDPERLFGEAFVQHHDHLAELAHQAGIDAELLGMLAGLAVAPLLRAYADRLLPLVERVEDGSTEGSRWRQGYCPVCGCWPALAERRGVARASFLRCSACGAAWRFPEQTCPYCANTEAGTVRTLNVEGERQFSVLVCDRCRGYLNVGTAFDPLPAELLPLDSAVTLPLDVAAIECGYARPAGSAFTIELAVPDEEWLEELA